VFQETVSRLRKLVKFHSPISPRFHLRLARFTDAVESQRAKVPELLARD
jgi:hypothetical protein